MEVWNDSCDWPFLPLENKTACAEKEPLPALRFLGIHESHIKTPLFRLGHWYGYAKDGRFVRKAVANYETVREICVLVKALYDGKTLGLRKSKTADALGAFIFDLHYALIQGWSETAKQCAAPEKIRPLLVAIKRLKSLPEGLEDQLKRLLELAERLK